MYFIVAQTRSKINRIKISKRVFTSQTHLKIKNARYKCQLYLKIKNGAAKRRPF